MSISADCTVRLDDGLVLGYVEIGDPAGRPVLFFHGTPGSRLQIDYPTFDTIADQLGCRVIAVDRPGLGLSQFRPYTVATWPDLVTAFADTLGLEQFAVIGTSGGGRYAAACAWKIPQRLTAASIVSGTCSFDLPGATTCLARHERQLYTIADKLPWLMRLLLRKTARDVRTKPGAVQTLFDGLSEPDRMLIAQPDVEQLGTRMLIGAFQQGERGVAHDLCLEARPWGVILGEISIPVQIWHGEEDWLVPITQARILVQHIPQTQTHFVPHEGHFSLGIGRFEDYLRAVTSDA